MAETREHSTLNEIDPEPEVLGASLLIFKGELSGLAFGGEREFSFLINGEEVPVRVSLLSPSRVQLIARGRRYIVEKAAVSSSQPAIKAGSPAASVLRVSSAEPGVVVAPISGVISAVLLKCGAHVSASDIVVRLEAMKMQNSLAASADGILEEIYVNVGDEVSEGQPLYKVTAS